MLEPVYVKKANAIMRVTSWILMSWENVKIQDQAPFFIHPEDFSYGADGSLLGKHVYIYDDHGNYAGISSYRSDVLAGETIYKYEYDVNGNWIKRTTLDIGPVFTICRSITYF
jgi:hypothetical protein